MDTDVIYAERYCYGWLKIVIQAYNQKRASFYVCVWGRGDLIYSYRMSHIIMAKRRCTTFLVNIQKHFFQFYRSGIYWQPRWWTNAKNYLRKREKGRGEKRRGAKGHETQTFVVCWRSRLNKSTCNDDAIKIVELEQNISNKNSPSPISLRIEQSFVIATCIQMLQSNSNLLQIKSDKSMICLQVERSQQ